MIPLETFRVALRSLRAHPLRTFLTLLGVIIGVMTVVTVVSIISGLNYYVRDKVMTLGADVFIVDKMGIITGRDQLIEAIKRKNITLSEYELVAQKCHECVMVGGSVGSVKPVKYGTERLADVAINGATSNMLELGALDIELGRFLFDAEVTHSRQVAVIGADVRDELFPGLDPVGKVLKIDDTPYKVIGLLAKKGSIFGETQDKVIYVPLNTFIKNFGARRSVEIFVKAGSETRMTMAEDEVRAILRGVRDTGYHERDPFDFVTAEALQSLWVSISGAAFSLMIFISSISLIVGGIVIMNIMLVSVTERTREIGIRKALGARRRDILLQFLFEAATLSSAGGLAGLALGVAGALLIGLLTPLPTYVSPVAIVLGLVTATLVGLFFGIYPAMRAARQDPIEALRYE